jgi:hypothetical protein
MVVVDLRHLIMIGWLGCDRSKRMKSLQDSLCKILAIAVGQAFGK